SSGKVNVFRWAPPLGETVVDIRVSGLWCFAYHSTAVSGFATPRARASLHPSPGLPSSSRSRASLVLYMVFQKRILIVAGIKGGYFDINIGLDDTDAFHETHFNCSAIYVTGCNGRFSL